MKEFKVRNNQFLTDVLEGLEQVPKQLHSKYFYDQKGDVLFQKIMSLPEYYLTRCELDIFQNKTKDLAKAVLADGSAFDLIELGAGDATKSIYLLKHLTAEKAVFTYMPIDISGNILSVLKEKLLLDVPYLDVNCLVGDYFKMLNEAMAQSSRRKVVMFLGGNIGNMELAECNTFCQKIRSNLTKGDLVIIGFDLKKHPQIILNAYSDRSGITAAFNLNLLTRINAELDANFDLSQFEHYQNYDPISGACKSYLISLKEQEVIVSSKSFHFAKHEPIYMEVSQKFSMEEADQLAHASGFTPIASIIDSKGWFTDAFWLAK